MNNCILGK